MQQGIQRTIESRGNLLACQPQSQVNYTDHTRPIRLNPTVQNAGAHTMMDCFSLAQPATELPMASAYFKTSRNLSWRSYLVRVCCTAVCFFVLVRVGGTEKHTEAKQAAISTMRTRRTWERREWCGCSHIPVMQQTCSEVACHSALWVVRVKSGHGQQHSAGRLTFIQYSTYFLPSLKRVNRFS